MSSYRVTQLVAGRALFILMCGFAAHAQNCGDSITSDTQLTADIGPCAGDGLTIATPGIVLDLNGFSIIGTGVGRAVIFDKSGPAPETTIKGPGTITGFGAAVSDSSGAVSHGALTVRDLTLEGNGTGVHFTNALGLRILNNTIDGGAVGDTGIYVFQGHPIKIKGNTILNHTGAGIRMAGEISGTGATIIENNVSQNGDGFVVQGPYFVTSPVLKMICNKFSNNSNDGIRIMLSFPQSGAVTVQGNEFSFNGRSGLNVSGAQDNAPAGVIEDNVANNNGLYGIEVNGPHWTVVDNVAMNNATDLFWNGVGATNCWSHNDYGTSIPDSLPACQ